MKYPPYVPKFPPEDSSYVTMQPVGQEYVIKVFNRNNIALRLRTRCATEKEAKKKASELRSKHRAGYIYELDVNGKVVTEIDYKLLSGFFSIKK